MKWPCSITANTPRFPENKRRRMHRRLEGIGDVEGAMLKALNSRKDKGRPFHNCEVRALTPLGQTVIRVFDYNKNKLFHKKWSY